jgi:hypothetical protein
MRLFAPFWQAVAADLRCSSMYVLSSKSALEDSALLLLLLLLLLVLLLHSTCLCMLDCLLGRQHTTAAASACLTNTLHLLL